MKKIILLFLCVILSGCATVENGGEGNTSKVELTKIKQVELGMSLSDVKSIMGDRIIVGYKLDNQKNIVEPTTLNCPYRTDSFEKGGKKYTVLYYFTNIRKADGIVADDELTALIFENDKLIGKGNDVLFRLRSGL
jgi:hypothetical protein